MSGEALSSMPIEKVGPMIRDGKVSPVEMVESALAEITKRNPELNAFLRIVEEQARREARAAEREISTGRWRGHLHGIPIAVKDNIYLRGVRTTAGSKILQDFVPEEDAEVVKCLKRAGAVIVGKTNLHEFAYGVTSENPHYGAVRNPWDTERIPGGSSGGSAVAVATGMCCAALGTDTGGSIRIPAALCGVVGFKPAFGQVAVEGTVPLAGSLDHVGPLTRTARDARIVYRYIQYDPERDQALEKGKLPQFERDWERMARDGEPEPERRVRIGVPREYFFDRVEEEVKRLVESAVAEMEDLADGIVEIPLPRIAEWDEASTTIALVEAAEYHAQQGWYPQRADEYGEDVRKRLEMGMKVSGVELQRAWQARKVAREEMMGVLLRDVDVLVAPTTPLAAPRIGEKTVRIAGREEAVRGALIRPNRPANLVGWPAVSVPCGFTESGLPVGMQLIGPEAGKVLGLARALEMKRMGNQHKGARV